jgi:hypothetical protein
MATGGSNYIDTTTGQGLSTSIANAFNQFPYLDQIFNADVKKCAQENMMSDCTPPSLAQIDADIVRADSILEFIMANEVYDRDTRLYLFQVIVAYLKVKKCVNAQFPCWGDSLYRTYIDYINEFEFVTS